MGLRFDRMLASTALLLVLTAATAQAGDPQDAIEAAVPIPEPANVPPPTAADIGSVPTATAPDASAAPASTESRPAAAAKPEDSATKSDEAKSEDAKSDAAKSDDSKPTAAGSDAAKSDAAAAPKADDATANAAAPAVSAPTASTPAAPASAASAPAVTTPGEPSVAPAATADAPSSMPATSTPAATAAPSSTPATADAPAATEQPTSIYAADLSAEDRPVAEKLHDVLSGRIERLFGRKNERTAVEAFYRDRGYAPLWVEKGAQSPRAAAAISYLKGVDADGLDPADYPTPDFKAAASPDALADAELKLTASVLTYARHAQIGQVHYTRISSDISYNLEAPDPADILANMANAKDVAAALDGYNPPQPGYKALKAKLAEVRAQRGETNLMRIDSGPLLRVGMHDERVPELRKRLGVEGDSADTTYDKALSDAVRKFQRQHGLSADGLLGTSTIAALNGPRRDREADIIIANMERWRWLPRDLGKAYVMVNLPDYTLKVVDNGKTVWSTKIVIGKPSMPTPLLTETMKYITVNPTWNVPPSIVQNEYLPALQQDPNALERIGLKVTQNRDGTIHIYQPPGDRNALGRIRFNFPNKFLVYQHDTPDKYLFAKDKRAYSHGCMRVQDPLKYGEVLLSIANPTDGYTAERLHRMFGSEERNITFRTPIPVHLTYQTAFVDDAGKLQIREDIYGRDSRILAVLRGDERRVADIPVERRREASARPPVFRMTPPAALSRPVTSAGGFFFGLFR